MDFVESLIVELPKFSEAYLAESDEDRKRSLVIELAAIHEGLTANYNHYSATELEKALESWISPYPKPIIRNHDTTTEPLGRVMAARMDKEADGSPFVRLQVAITDNEAMEKVDDERYLTGSVGGKAGQALCSVCGKDWANSSMFEMPCRHERGKVYKGKLAYFEMKDIAFKEYSFVNVPADQRSSIRSIGSGTEDVTDSDEGVKNYWVKAHVFAVDMNNEAVTELSESGERNVLAEMKKREASPFYHVLRGAFLTTLALAEAEAEETTSMPAEDEDDILAVAENLTQDLASPEEDEAPEEDAPAEDLLEAPEEDDADPEEGGDPEEEPGEEDETPAEEAEESDEEPAAEEEDKAPEGQEDPADEDDPPADPTREDAPEEEPDTEPEEDDATETNVAESDERISALEAEVASLSEENVKLRKVLKTQLAERVVDTKIALGLESRENRDELVSEHADRTASSLADSIRDLAGFTPVQRDMLDAPIVESSSHAVGDDDGRALTSESQEDEEPQKSPEEQLIDTFTDAFMGRRKIN